MALDAYILDDISIYDMEPAVDPEPEPEPVVVERTYGTVLVFDMRSPGLAPSGPADALGQWYAWRTLGEPMGAVTHQGVQYYIARDGTIRYEKLPASYEADERYFDDEEDQILTKVHLAPLSLAGIQGAEAVYRVMVNGLGAGAADMKLTTVVVKERSTAGVTAEREFSMDETMGRFEFLTAQTRMTRIEISLEEVAGDNLTEGHRIKGLGLEVGITGQLRRVSTRQRI